MRSTYLNIYIYLSRYNNKTIGNMILERNFISYDIKREQRAPAQRILQFIL